MPEFTEINCATPESAHALHAYLLVELGQEEEAPEITAEVEGSALRVTHNYDNQAVRQEWDAQLIGYRDGRESLENTLWELRRHSQHQRDAVEFINSALGIRG